MSSRHEPSTTARRADGIAVDWGAPAIDERLRVAGLRVTRARRSILALLMAIDTHPTVEQLQGMLADAGHEVRQATLYQNLAQLADAGAIASFADERGLLRFDGYTAPHPHIICTGCGRIGDASSDLAAARELDRAVSAAATPPAGWLVHDVRLELRAVCPECAAAR